MKILRSKKLLLSLICALVLVFGSCVSVYASTVVSIEDAENRYAYNTMVCYSGGVYRIYSTNHPMYCVDGYLHYANVNDGVMKTYLWSDTDLVWIEEGGSSHGSGAMAENATYICASDYDVLYEDGTIFFRSPSPLVTVAKTIQPMTVLGQILGLLPLLIPCLVGLVALRKGLALLWNRLHKA